MKTNKNILFLGILLIAGMALVVPASAELQWDIETVAPSGAYGSYITLAFDGEKNPLISYYNTSNSYLNIATKEGDDWTVTSIGEKNMLVCMLRFQSSMATRQSVIGMLTLLKFP